MHVELYVHLHQSTSSTAQAGGGSFKERTLLER